MPAAPAKLQKHIRMDSDGFSFPLFTYVLSVKQVRGVLIGNIITGSEWLFFRSFVFFVATESVDIIVVVVVAVIIVIFIVILKINILAILVNISELYLRSRFNLEVSRIF